MPCEPTEIIQTRQTAYSPPLEVTIKSLWPILTPLHVPLTDPDSSPCGLVGWAGITFVLGTVSNKLSFQWQSYLDLLASQYLQFSIKIHYFWNMGAVIMILSLHRCQILALFPGRGSPLYTLFHKRQLIVWSFKWQNFSTEEEAICCCCFHVSTTQCWIVIHISPEFGYGVVYYSWKNRRRGGKSCISVFVPGELLS